MLLATAVADRLPGLTGDGLGAVRELPAPARHVIAPHLSDAFQHTYGWAVTTMTLALLPALLLPRHRTRAATNTPTAPAEIPGAESRAVDTPISQQPPNGRG